MASQQATFTDIIALANFVGQLVQIGCDFDVVQNSSGEWVVDLS